MDSQTSFKTSQREGCNPLNPPPGSASARFAAFNVFEKFASVLLQVPTPKCLSFRLRNIPASIIAQQ